MSRALTTALLTLLLLAIGCEPRHAGFSEEARRIDVHERARMIAVIHGDGSIRIRRSADGSLVSRVAPFDARPRPYAVDLELPRCATRMSDNGLLVVDYENAVRVYDVMTGRRVSTLPMPRIGVYRACSAIGPDSKILVHAPRYHGSGFIRKLGRHGEVVFERELPDIGPLVGAIEVDRATGDCFVTSRSHVVSISPDGRVNWAHRNRDPGTRR